jgi:CDP-diacylglycerol--serine O-phosphatidyltransferase
MFNFANILTGLNLLSGVVSIIFTFSGRLEWAVAAILLGAIFDFFDGFAARLLNQQGELGKQLDSLADLITFGVAPGMIVFVLLILSGAWEITVERGGILDDLWLDGTMGYSVNYWTSVFFNDLVGNLSPILPTHFYGWYLILPFTALFIPFFSMFRLAKFNLDTRQATGFIGLPTPANSIFFASFALLIWDGFGQENWKTLLSMTLIKDQVLMTFIVVFSFLLVSEIKLFSLKFSHFKWSGNELRYSFLLSSGIIIALLYVWALPIIVLLYLLLSVVSNLLKPIKN